MSSCLQQAMTTQTKCKLVNQYGGYWQGSSAKTVDMTTKYSILQGASNHEIVVVGSLLAQQQVHHIHLETVHPDRQQPNLLLLLLSLLLYHPLLYLLLCHLLLSLLVGLFRDFVRLRICSTGNGVLVRVLQKATAENGINDVDFVGLQILNEVVLGFGCIVFQPQTDENGADVAVLLLHFLVVASALLGLAGAHEQGHGFENFVSAPHVFVKEVLVVYLQKPVVPFVLLQCPVPEFLVAVALLRSSGLLGFGGVLGGWLFGGLFGQGHSDCFGLLLAIWRKGHFVWFIEEGRVEKVWLVRLQKHSFGQQLTLLNHWLQISKNSPPAPRSPSSPTTTQTP